MRGQSAEALLDQHAGASGGCGCGARVQRRVELRDVGRGEASGFARVPELITRLNTMSGAVTYAVTGGALTYTVRPGQAEIYSHGQA